MRNEPDGGVVVRTHNLNFYNPPASLRSYPHSARHPPLHREGYNKATPSVSLRSTASRAVETALGQEISSQWEISKFAGGKKPTGLFARKRLLTPKPTPPQTKNTSSFFGAPGGGAKGSGGNNKIIIHRHSRWFFIFGL